MTGKRILQKAEADRTMIFLYGPPGSGKSLAGRVLADNLQLPFVDLDEQIEISSGESISQIFARDGEGEFRRRESQLLAELLELGNGIFSLGGGALLDPENRAMVERSGKILTLTAPLEVLLERLSADEQARPLLDGEMQVRLVDLLEQRREHYSSFDLQIDTTGLTPQDIAWEGQIQLGVFHVSGMGRGYDVLVKSGSLKHLGDFLSASGMNPPMVVVSDENVASFYAEHIKRILSSARMASKLVVLEPGEQHKNLRTVERLWQEFMTYGLERKSSVIAFGGGVVGDLAGFAAATYLRGVAWAVVPTSLLAMVDASLGGKTGFDLPGGKNLVGAFHAPRLVSADPQVLATLPEAELRSGMAEVVKHGIIADPRLFETCANGWQAVMDNLDEVVRRAIAVKVKIIQVDPYEGNERAALNLGHTLGHALEHASGYRLRHGEAVAIGMVAAARLAERLEIAERGLATLVADVLGGLGLPTEIPPGYSSAEMLQAIGVDKKRADGQVRFVLPVKIGEVRTGIVIENLDLLFT